MLILSFNCPKYLLIPLILFSFVSIPYDYILAEQLLLDEFTVENNPFSFLIEGPNNFLYPSQQLKVDRTQLELSGNYKDIFRERKENGDFNYLNQLGIGIGFIKPFEYNSRKSIVSVRYTGNTLNGDFPSAKVTQFRMPDGTYMIGFATTFGEHDVGVSYKNQSASLSTDFSLEPFPKSKKEDENTYLFDPLENFFGTEFSVTGTRKKSLFIAEDNFPIIKNHSIDLRIIINSESHAYAVQHTNNKDEIKYVDVPLNIRCLKGEINYYYKLNDKWRFKFIFSDLKEWVDLEITPRDADQTEITSFGVTKSTINAFNIGGGAYCRINNKTEAFLKINRSLSSEKVPINLSTPVLGKKIIIPIVHRLIGTGSLNIPIYHLQLGYAKDISEKFKLNLLLGYLFSGSTVNFDGEAQLAVGLENYPIDEELKIGWGLIHLNSRIKYKISENVYVSYQIYANVPYYELTRVGYEPPPEDKGWRIRGGGGLEHTISICFSF
ncbi:hypothetical protein ES703_67401 [subsurface metagenome]